MTSTGRSVALRQATRAEAPALRAILYDTFESTWRPQISAAAARAYREKDRPAAYVAERGQEFWVAEREGRPIGFVDWDGDFVNALHVLSTHARRGVGGALMDFAEARIADAGFETARLETDTFNLTSQAFYAKRGYIEVDQYLDEEWKSGLTTLLLAKPLGPSFGNSAVRADGTYRVDRGRGR